MQLELIGVTMMNKYQEALEILCTYSDGNPNSADELVGMMLQKADDTLQQLVNLTIPKKAILTHDYDGYVYECPVCHNEFRPDYIMNTVKWSGCPYCLQVLDWSDEE